MSIANNYQTVQEKIAVAAKKSGRKSGDILVVAVTKTWPVEVVRQAAAAGIKSFGENYVQEALPKIESVHADWHFVGHLQSKKVKLIEGKFSLIHSVDSESVVQEFAKLKLKKPQDILVQVQFVPEETKSGIPPAHIKEFLEFVQKSTGVRLRGVMVMPPFTPSEGEKRRLFTYVQEEVQKWKGLVSAPHSLNELSMGTTHDYELAIEAGSTIVRIGSALFGERKSN